MGIDQEKEVEFLLNFLQLKVRFLPKKSVHMWHFRNIIYYSSVLSLSWKCTLTILHCLTTLISKWYVMGKARGYLDRKVKRSRSISWWSGINCRIVSAMTRSIICFSYIPHLSSLLAPDHVPTAEDILHLRIPTTSVNEINFSFSSSSIRYLSFMTYHTLQEQHPLMPNRKRASKYIRLYRSIIG